VSGCHMLGSWEVGHLLRVAIYKYDAAGLFQGPLLPLKGAFSGFCWRPEISSILNRSFGRSMTHCVLPTISPRHIGLLVFLPPSIAGLHQARQEAQSGMGSALYCCHCVPNRRKLIVSQSGLADLLARWQISHPPSLFSPTSSFLLLD
jgi:hypothetical protein